MRGNRYTLSSSQRMLLALTMFAAAVLTAMILVFGLPERAPGTARLHKAAVETEDAAFFYDAIGRAPTSLTAASAGGHAAASEQASYTLEIKVASDRDEAERTIDTLHEHGIEAYYTPLTRAGRVVFRVRQGVFASRTEAEKAAIALRQASTMIPAVVKLQ